MKDKKLKTKCCAVINGKRYCDGDKVKDGIVKFGMYKGIDDYTNYTHLGWFVERKDGSIRYLIDYLIDEGEIKVNMDDCADGDYMEFCGKFEADIKMEVVE